MPDFFEGSPAEYSWYPPDNKEKETKLNNFFSTNGAPPKGAGRIPGLLKEIEKQYPEIQKWGVVGFCWGGKVVSLTSGDNSPYKAAAECHPAMVDPEDAEKIKIPLAMLASKDEPAEDVKKFEEKLTGPKHFETFGDQIHGFSKLPFNRYPNQKLSADGVVLVAARADLEDPRVKEEYERGYKTLLTFFGKHL